MKELGSTIPTRCNEFGCVCWLQPTTYRINSCEPLSTHPQLYKLYATSKCKYSEGRSAVNRSVFHHGLTEELLTQFMTPNCSASSHSWLNRRVSRGALCGVSSLNLNYYLTLTTIIHILNVLHPEIPFVAVVRKCGRCTSTNSSDLADEFSYIELFSCFGFQV